MYSGLEYRTLPIPITNNHVLQLGIGVRTCLLPCKDMKYIGAVFAVPATCLRYAVENFHAAEGCCGKESENRATGVNLSIVRRKPRKTAQLFCRFARAAQIGGDPISSYYGGEGLSAERRRTGRPVAFQEGKMTGSYKCCRIRILGVLFSIKETTYRGMESRRGELPYVKRGGH
jgi:hypothetical protein